MSTKGLMADKRVAQVTLNALGKADTLTLAPGWTFEGQSGPFKLDNVDHGHRIVKSATNPNAPGKAARSPRAPRQPIDPDAPYVGPPAPSGKELQAIAPRTDIPEAYIYRIKLTDTGIPNVEVAGWIRSTRPIEARDINQRARETLGSTLRARGSTSPGVPSGKRWTVEDERAARKANDAGCPWPSVFRPGRSTKEDAPLPEEAS